MIHSPTVLIKACMRASEGFKLALVDRIRFCNIVQLVSRPTLNPFKAPEPEAQSPKVNLRCNRNGQKNSRSFPDVTSTVLDSETVKDLRQRVQDFRLRIGQLSRGSKVVSVLGLPYGVVNMNPKKQLLRSLRASKMSSRRSPIYVCYMVMLDLTTCLQH